MKPFRVWLSLFVALCAAALQARTPAPSDPVQRLQQRIDSGDVALDFEPAHGYLPAVLAALKVPVSSQGLVFSRTSLQVDRIAPWSPRALYFSDDVYVGWVQGGPIMEVAVVDPVAGAAFYTLSQERTARPHFERESRVCLGCHQSAVSTRGVPGFIMRSVVTDRHGYPVVADGGATTDATALGKRWGGWYVTGGLGSLEHMGNATVPALRTEMGNVDVYLARTKQTTTGGLSNLEGRFDTAPYLSPHSDAVALLVLAHQTSVHNLIARTHVEAEKYPDTDPLPLSVKGAADQLLRALFFDGEASYAGTVTGTSAFAREFSAAGPADSKGRSLRDFDLDRRLFRYPLSYLVYSDAFAALPKGVKTYLTRRIAAGLAGEDTGAPFTHISEGDRTAIREILADTRPDPLR
jgi:hypothetical protein